MNEPTFRKSTRCASGGCVEVAATDSAVLVRDSKHADSPVLRLDRPAWTRLLGTLRHDMRPAGLHYDDDRNVELWQKQAGVLVTLTFTPAEWDAFIAGVKAGEFDVDVLAAVRAGAMDGAA